MAGTYIFMWLEKTFHVTKDEILTYSGLNTSHSFTTEEKKNGKKMPKTKEVSAGIGTLSFNLSLSVLQGNNVKEEHDWWVAECEKGTYSYIYMGGQKFGNYKWRIKQVDMSDLVTINDGSIWKSCTLSIGFEEYFEQVKKTKAEKKAEKLQKKMRKAMDKAQSAKNEKARAKAAAKAADYQKKFEEQKAKVAEEKAAQVKANAQAVTLQGAYYDMLMGGEAYKNIQRKIREEYKKRGA